MQSLECVRTAQQVITSALLGNHCDALLFDGVVHKLSLLMQSMLVIANKADEPVLFSEVFDGIDVLALVKEKDPQLDIDFDPRMLSPVGPLAISILSKFAQEHLPKEGVYSHETESGAVFLVFRSSQRDAALEAVGVDSINVSIH